MDYNNIPPETIEFCICPYCNTDSAVREIQYGYPSPTEWKDSRDYLHKNYFPSQNVWVRCLFCGEEDPA